MTPANFAFIDGQNLYSGVFCLGWKCDLFKLRQYLSTKYGVTRAFYFMGFMPARQSLYDTITRAGFDLKFKPVTNVPGLSPKGNVDADLVLEVMKEINNFKRAVIVSGDGDFYSLVDYLVSVDKLETVLAPNRRFCSRLTRKSAQGRIAYAEDLEHLLRQ